MQLNFVDRDLRYGFHMPKYPTMLKTVSEVLRNPEYSAMQLYISNSRSKSLPNFNVEDLKRTRERLEKHREIYVAIHGCLLYNLAGTVNGEEDSHYHSALESTLRCLTAELDFAVALGRPAGVGVGVVVHPGSRKRKNEGLICVSRSIEEVLTRKTVESKLLSRSMKIDEKEFISRRKIILENAAGEGTKLCSTLEEIRDVILEVKEELRPQIRVCIDTAHSFGKGIYDWGIEGEIDRFYRDFEEIVGMEYLELFHFNDSCCSDDKRNDAPFCSCKDRHESIGAGYIFGSKERILQVKKFVEEAKNHGIALIGETPGPYPLEFELVGHLLKGGTMDDFIC